MPSPTLRLAQPEDLPHANALWVRSRWEAEPWLEERMAYSSEQNLEHFVDVIAARNDLWLAFDGAEMLGLLAIQRDQIDQLFIEPARQRAGVGTKLIEHAKELSPDLLELYTHQRNTRARRFYEKQGFEAVAFGTSPPPESEPDVSYRWRP